MINTDEFIQSVCEIEQTVVNAIDTEGFFPTSSEILDALEQTQDVSNFHHIIINYIPHKAGHRVD